MINRKRRRASTGSFFLFESARNRTTMQGFGFGEYIRLRDEFGNIWRGEAEVQPDDTVRYRFRDSAGRSISGVADSYGIMLRDDKGNVWRGFVD